MKRFARHLTLLLGTTVFAGTAFAIDWPQWQGPDRNSMSKETGLMKEWPKEGPALAWKITGLGGGDGAPSIANGKMYGMSNQGSEQVVWARAEADGKPLWTVKLAPAVEQRMPQSKEGPGCTPTVDGDRLYVVGMGGELACLQAADGKVLWQKSFTQDFGGQVPTWSYRESPLIDGDKLICTPGGPDAMMVALNKMTGETIWKSALPAAAPTPQPNPNDAQGGGRRGGRGGGRFARTGAAYSSPIAFDFEGVRQYANLTSGALIGVRASDGKFLWRYDKPANGNGINISTPIYHEGLVFAASAYGAGGGAVKLFKDGDAIRAEEAYFTNKMQNHHGGMLVIDGALYGASGGNEGGALACLDFKTGEVLWDERDERRAPKGSVAFADGRIYYRTEAGPVLLIEPNKKEYLERGRFDQPDRTRLPAWAHPVVANGKLYIRDQDTLYCYDVKAK